MRSEFQQIRTDVVFPSVSDPTSAPTFGRSGGGRGVLKTALDPPFSIFEAIWTHHISQLEKASPGTMLTDGPDAEVEF